MTRRAGNSTVIRRASSLDSTVQAVVGQHEEEDLSTRQQHHSTRSEGIQSRSSVRDIGYVVITCSFPLLRALRDSAWRYACSAHCMSRAPSTHEDRIRRVQARAHPCGAPRRPCTQHRGCSRLSLRRVHGGIHCVHVGGCGTADDGERPVC